MCYLTRHDNPFFVEGESHDILLLLSRGEGRAAASAPMRLIKSHYTTACQIFLCCNTVCLMSYIYMTACLMAYCCGGGSDYELLHFYDLNILYSVIALRNAMRKCQQDCINNSRFIYVYCIFYSEVYLTQRLRLQLRLRADQRSCDQLL